MSIRITELTEERKRLIPVVRDEWIATCLSTEPMDKTKTRGLLDAMYASAGKPGPKFVIHLPSPAHIAWAVGLLRTCGDQIMEQAARRARNLIALEACLSAVVDLTLLEALGECLRGLARPDVSDTNQDAVCQDLSEKMVDPAWQEVFKQHGYGTTGHVEAVLADGFPAAVHGAIQRQVEADLSPDAAREAFKAVWNAPRFNADNVMDSQVAAASNEVLAGLHAGRLLVGPPGGARNVVGAAVTSELLNAGVHEAHQMLSEGTVPACRYYVMVVLQGAIHSRLAGLQQQLEEAVVEEVSFSDPSLVASEGIFSQLRDKASAAVIQATGDSDTYNQVFLGLHAAYSADFRRLEDAVLGDITADVSEAAACRESSHAWLQKTFAAVARSISMEELDRVRAALSARGGHDVPDAPRDAFADGMLAEGLLSEAAYAQLEQGIRSALTFGVRLAVASESHRLDGRNKLSAQVRGAVADGLQPEAIGDSVGALLEEDSASYELRKNHAKVLDAVSGAEGMQVRAAFSAAKSAAVQSVVHATRAELLQSVQSLLEEPMPAWDETTLAEIHRQAKSFAERELWRDFGQFEYWLSFYDYFSRIGVDTSALQPQIDFAKACGWSVLFWDWAFVSERPKLILRDDQGRLHCEDGPAIAYEGFEVHAVHGVRVPAFVVENPGSITVEHIETEQNAEVRRVMIDRYGQQRYLCDSGATEVHRDDWGVLYRKEIPGDEPLVMVKVVNSTPEPDGSFKDYFIRVDPSVTRAKQAVAWTFGLEEHEYEPVQQT